MVETVRMTPTLFKAQAGEFSSDYRYLRAATGTGSFRLSNGRTLRFSHVIDNPGGQHEAVKFAWRWKTQGYVNIVINEDLINNPGHTVADFTAEVKVVKIT